MQNNKVAEIWKFIILTAESSEDCDKVIRVFEDNDTVVAMDIMKSQFDLLYRRLDVPNGLLQGFCMTDRGYLYFFRPERISYSKVVAFFKTLDYDELYDQILIMNKV